jgi:serine/threonine protein phosphatase PrpC
MAEDEGEYFFSVADGLGGHDKGEVASELVVTTTMEQFYQRETEEFLGEAMEKAQNALMEKQQAEHAFGKMKTTYTGLYLRENMAQWGHVGDSRVYYFDRHHMKKRTLDHSVPQMLVASGEIKEKEIRYHPDRNHLLRVMGTEWEQPRYELTPFMKLKKRRQAFLLCTDGFWELITEKEMEQCLKKAANVEDWIVSMEVLVREHGQDIDMDNYTAIGVFVE